MFRTSLSEILRSTQSLLIQCLLSDNCEGCVEGVYGLAIEQDGIAVQIHGEACPALEGGFSWHLSAMDSWSLPCCSCCLLCKVYSPFHVS